MNKRITAGLLVMVICLLSGCQLAVPETQASTQPDRLVGVFVTTEYLDLFDFDAFLQDNVDEVLKGGDITVNDTGKYNGRIYAGLVEEKNTDGAGGEIPVHQYEFTGLEGMLLACFYMDPAGQQGTSSNGYWANTTDEGFSDGKAHYKSSDDGDSVEQSACIYVPHDSGEVVFYFNPVFQTAGGEVYLVSGNSMHQNTVLGGAMTYTLSDEQTYTSDGVETTYSSKYEVTIDCIEVPAKVILIQMDENHREVRRDEYIPGQMPEELTPEENAAYILIEEYCADAVLRSMNQPGDSMIEVFYRMDNNICVKDYTNINWPETE